MQLKQLKKLMTEAKYQIGDRFDAWVIIQVNFLSQPIYKLHNNINNGLLVINQELMEKILADKELVRYENKST